MTFVFPRKHVLGNKSVFWFKMFRNFNLVADILYYFASIKTNVFPNNVKSSLLDSALSIYAP